MTLREGVRAWLSHEVCRAAEEKVDMDAAAAEIQNGAMAVLQRKRAEQQEGQQEAMRAAGEPLMSGENGAVATTPGATAGTPEATPGTAGPASTTDAAGAAMSAGAVRVALVGHSLGGFATGDRTRDWSIRVAAHVPCSTLRLEQRARDAVRVRLAARARLAARPLAESSHLRSAACGQRTLREQPRTLRAHRAVRQRHRSCAACAAAPPWVPPPVPSPPPRSAFSGRGWDGRGWGGRGGGGRGSVGGAGGPGGALCGGG
jgi:hypothetical protein